MKYSLKILTVCLIISFGVSFLGCEGTIKTKKKPKAYSAPEEEALWIRNGEPIKFENEMWYPSDTLENLLDYEVILMGDYRGVEYFIEKADVRPFGQLYTKFAAHKFRKFRKERRKEIDQNQKSQ
ncbi:MAG: hypothetical protein ABIJ41_01245 [Candidatus Omnitrophota bacterium]